jgi:predicted nucleotidyltransferase
MDALTIPPAPIRDSRFAAALEALDPDLSQDEMRAEALRAIRAAIDDGHAAIRARFDAGATGTETVTALCRLVDDLLVALLDFTVRRVFPLSNPTKGERLAVIAVGGYGRGELAPFSDIDLLFLRPYKKTPHNEQVIEFILYFLWDLGFKVGQAVRSLDECVRLAKGDITIRTAILESRPLWGDAKLHAELMRCFWKEIVAGGEADFVEAKLAERDARHARMGDSRYVLEPNVKEGKGGLRDLQTLFWLTKYIYRVSDVSQIVKLGVLSEREARRFARAQNFLWHVRCQLHYLSGRAEDRLTFDLQERVGALMGYTDHVGARGVERFMKHYFLYAKEVGDLTRIFCAALEESHKRKPRSSFLGRLRWRRKGDTAAVDGFAVKGDRLTVAAPDAFAQDPVKLIGLFAVAHRHNLDIHPEALRLVTRSLKLIDDGLRADADANRLFMEMIAAEDNSEFWLRRMNESGVFGRFVPDFGRVVAQMQHDMYHVFTVDEHTLMALGILHRIEAGELKEEMPVISDGIHKIQSRRALYLSVLLHDIAKGRGGDHSELGAEVALRLGPRLGLTDEETETVSWLVRHHLIMSNTAFKRDVSDPRTVRDFVGRAPATPPCADRRRHPRRRPDGVERLEGRAAARAVDRRRGDDGRRPQGRGPRHPRAHRARRAALRARRLGRGGIRRPSRAWLPGLLAVVRRADARPPGAPHPQGRGEGRELRRRRADRRPPRCDRDHDLRHRPRRAVLADRRRDRARRRQRRRRPHHHAGVRHGARRVLDPGPQRGDVRPGRQARAPQCADRARGDRAPPAGPRARRCTLVAAGAGARLQGRAARPHRQRRLQHSHGNRGQRP